MKRGGQSNLLSGALAAEKNKAQGGSNARGATGEGEAIPQWIHLSSFAPMRPGGRAMTTRHGHLASPHQKPTLTFAARLAMNKYAPCRLIERASAFRSRRPQRQKRPSVPEGKRGARKHGISDHDKCR
jgi:hypothetical protein